jgi:2,4-dienoyl-CoA reductase-like NADH-dependent reductase (Old Yellow Enzyme family)
MAHRGQFVAEIVRASRKAVGADFPIILRYSQWKQQDFTARLAESPDELEAFLTPLVDAGVDLFHCSQRRFWESEFEGSDLNLAGWTKKLTGVPTITVGSISLDKDFIPEPGEGFFSGGDIASIDKLLESLERGEFDLAAVGRALIANPDWANKVQKGGVSTLAPYEKEMLMKLV